MEARRRPAATPIEPPPTRFLFPDPRRARGREGVIATGGDFEPGTLLAAYRAGIFPWPMNELLVPWCSPNPRAIFPLEDEPHWSRSLRRSLRRKPFDVTVDEAFDEVIASCGDTRDSTWILPELERGYVELHALGWAHSVEVWNRDSGELVGGIYGVAIGGAFAGESMFHTETDASKVAFAHLVHHLRDRGFVLFDVQVQNDHLESLGCVEIPRTEYLDRLAEAHTRTPTWLAPAKPTR
ncbi:MAG: leucyl/phenylalanyl-tRNA--protein transferase [Polyangiaceae bacterium]